MGLIRRTLSVAALALALSSTSEARARKSLSFRPPHPDALFQTSPVHVLNSRDCHQVAQIFLDRLAYPGNSYFIRKDSYTDERTGISHVFVRQVVNGLEVADGNINLNIYNGTVLSYGNSFFAGSAKHSTLLAPNWHQAVYCAEPTTNPSDHACGETLEHLQGIASLHSFQPFSFHNDPRAAVFFFLQAANPGTHYLVSNFNSYRVEPHLCTDKHEEPMSCLGWRVTGVADGLEPVFARSVYIQTPGPNGSTKLNLAWRLEVTLPDNQYEAYVSAHDPSKIIAVTDWVVDAPTPDEDGWLTKLQRHVLSQQQSLIEEIQVPLHAPEPYVTAHAPIPIATQGTYNVWKWGINDPVSGKRSREVAPKDRKASPLGWHSIPAKNDPFQTSTSSDIVNFTTTVGNNVIAHENWDGGADWKDNKRPDGGPGLVFDFPYGADPSEPGWQNVEPIKYSNLSVTQLFYVVNMYHDLLYIYGFDERSGNFQQHNFGKGGTENDAVLIFSQDSTGFNNANFMTPPDGQNGRCRMYVWNTAKPFRDGGLDQGIVIHELSHGLSTRLTGGPRDSTCLGLGESGGMGEGWGDFIATMVRSSKEPRDYPMGAWAANEPPGIRHFQYSTNKTTNPSMYDYLQRPQYREVHAIGEVWAEILFVILGKMIEKHGFADSLFPSADSQFYRVLKHKDGRVSQVPKNGNTLMLQLIVDGMKLQPCRPTILQARDAIFQADEQLTGGENSCVLWKGFADRGLGTDAKKLGFASRPSINGFKVPPECQ